MANKKKSDYVIYKFGKIVFRFCIVVNDFSGFITIILLGFIFSKILLEGGDFMHQLDRHVPVVVIAIKLQPIVRIYRSDADVQYLVILTIRGFDIWGILIFYKHYIFYDQCVFIIYLELIYIGTYPWCVWFETLSLHNLKFLAQMQLSDNEYFIKVKN